MTDVTGFGMIAHAREMALASNVSVKLYASRIPLLEGALDCVRAGYIPGGLIANREFAECVVRYDDGISEEMKTILFDPQTAGGLLIAVAAEDAAASRASSECSGRAGSRNRRSSASRQTAYYGCGVIPIHQISLEFLDAIPPC